MAIDTSVPRSRRALLAGGIGGMAALVAGALGRPLPAGAADGETMVVGGEYTATSVTKLKTSSVTALAGVSSNSVGVEGRGYVGVSGSSLLPYGIGVKGSSAHGPGVHGGGTTGVLGASDTGVGVEGASNSGIGVYGNTMTTRKPAIKGRSEGGTGVQGLSIVGTDPASPLCTGVYGYAAKDANARGVTGETTAGRGINGIATTGTGLYGQATTGYALRAVGRVKLDKCAGVATILATKNSVVVTPGIDLVSTSAVVATLQGNAGGSTTVKRVAVNTTANTFTIYLTANATQNVKVAWHVFG